MGYYIDLSAIDIDSYKEKLLKAHLIPSRVLLKEKSDERFEHFKKFGLKNVKELQQFLKKKDKLVTLLKEPCFNEEYLTVLLREINSIQPKPNKIKEFVNLPPYVSNNLEKLGIKDTVSLFNHVKNKESRTELSQKASLSETEVVVLAKLADLSRIKWVGAGFARVLFECGYDTAEKVANANYDELYNKVIQMNKERSLYKGQIGKNDMKILVEAAKEVSLEIEF
jgi:predicted hydrocarbon binding protein